MSFLRRWLDREDPARWTTAQIDDFHRRAEAMYKDMQELVQARERPEGFQSPGLPMRSLLPATTRGPQQNAKATANRLSI